MARTARAAIDDAPIVCRNVVRIKELRRYQNPDTMIGWRRGPITEDGFWMVTRGRKNTAGADRSWAVRVVLDPAAEGIGLEYEALDDALYGRQETHAAEDAYLAALDVVRMVAPDDLAKLRDAVLAGQVGGATDGKGTQE